MYALEGNNCALEGNIYRKMHTRSSFVLTRSARLVSLLAVFYGSVSHTDFMYMYITVKKNPSTWLNYSWVFFHDVIV